MSVAPSRKLGILITYWESGRKVIAVAQEAHVSAEIVRRWERFLLESAEHIFSDDADRKLRIVIEYYCSGHRVGEIARNHGVSGESVRQWVAQLTASAEIVFGYQGGYGALLRYRRTIAAQKLQIDALEDELGKYRAVHGLIELDGDEENS
jgi:hypothetical protein